ncbi:MAG TPA: sterol desaturase family protein [Myxococcota bacterium]|jgi:sterol desaturase/sphingolipid hydroxylase (fatty acid hydroxylase superfamily)|nr:sterol desaturase family protein [Myxococcota bacterium]
MGKNYIALAVPLFFAGIGIEVLVARRRGVVVHRFADAAGDVGCGVVQQVVGLFWAAGLLAGYGWLYDHARVVTLWGGAGGAVVWAAAVVGVDFLYYWWHRLSHEVSFLWAAHVVHHQSEDYNLAVALRQAPLTNLTIWVFYAPLALLGVPPLVYATTAAFSTLYQFWIHTELVGKLGPLERVINTPSLHRVHHAINPRYLDKNYGATFMIWDRLFGTYAAEEEPCVYGTVRPLASFNPLWAQVAYLVELAKKSWATPRFADKLRVWWKSPAWHPPGVPGGAPPEVSRATFVKYDVPRRRGVVAYVSVQLALIVAATFAVLLYYRQLPLALTAAVAVVVLVALGTCAALLEGRRWAVPAEFARWALAVALAVTVLR